MVADCVCFVNGFTFHVGLCFGAPSVQSPPEAPTALLYLSMTPWLCLSFCEDRANLYSYHYRRALVERINK